MHKKIDRMRRQLAGESLGSGDEGEEVCVCVCVCVYGCFRDDVNMRRLRSRVGQREDLSVTTQGSFPGSCCCQRGNFC